MWGWRILTPVFCVCCSKQFLYFKINTQALDSQRAPCLSPSGSLPPTLPLSCWLSSLSACMRCSLVLMWRLLCVLQKKQERNGEDQVQQEGAWPAEGRGWLTKKLLLPRGWRWQIRATGGSGAEHINERFKNHEKLALNWSKQPVLGPCLTS